MMASEMKERICKIHIVKIYNFMKGSLSYTCKILQVKKHQQEKTPTGEV